MEHRTVSFFTSLVIATCAANVAMASDSHDLVGIIADLGGTPVPGAEVLIYTAHPRSGPSPFCPSCYPDCSKHATTDADGTFRIPALADWLKFRVLVVRDGFEPTFVGGVDPQRGPMHAELTVRAHPDAANAVSGRVLDLDDKPVVGATVRIIGRKDSGGGMQFGDLPGVDPAAVSDGSGMFHVHSTAGPGLYFAQIEARNLAPRVQANMPLGSPTDVRLTVGATLTGHVVDDQGKRIAGVVVEARSGSHAAEDVQFDTSIATSDDGRFTISNVPPGQEYLLFARMDSLGAEGRSATVHSVMTDADGSTAPEVNLVATKAIAISGRVTLSDGAVLPPGVRIAIERSTVGDHTFVPVAPDGTFRFAGVPRDEPVALAVKIPGYRLHESLYARAGAYRILSALNKGATHFELVLDRAKSG